MFSRFFPDSYCDSVYEIDFRALYAKGYRGIIFDIDNTLVLDGAPADKRAIAFFKKLKKIGFKTLLLSNNKEGRVKSFADSVGICFYIFSANKPAKRGYLQAMELLGTGSKNTVFIGDQIFTDIWGANRTGIRSVLTDPIQKYREELQIIVKRFFEIPIIWAYKNSSKRNSCSKQ